MSIPYHQYVDYSNPATPRVYSWEVASATSTSEQDPLQLPQDPEVSFQHHSQQQQISPSQLDLQQLPPPLQPHQHQLHQVTTSPQEHTSQLHHVQHRQQQFTPHHQTIQVAPSPAQPQYRFETVTEEDFIQSGGARPSASRRRGASRPPALHVDTSRASSASASASVVVPSPGALSSAGAGTGPLRIPHSRGHVHSAHPYRRPQSRAASASGSGSAQLPSVVRSRRVSELQSEQTAQTSVGGAAAPPTVGTAQAVACPAQGTWREGLLGLSTSMAGQGPGGASFDPEATPTGATHGLPMPSFPSRRYTVRADIHYGAEENVITAMFELPGVKKTDLHITMSVCPFTRVRQLSISGLSRAVLPFQGHSVRERKFGEFFRTMAVPPETRPEDIAVELEDGILTLKIPGGAPAQAEQPQDIPIP